MSQPPGATTGSDTAQTIPIGPIQKILEFLKEYKELFAAVAFFAGGILWILGYFATKEELGGA